MCGRQKPDQVENPIPLKSNPSPKSPANPQPFTSKSADLSTASSSQLSTTSTATASSTSPTAIRSTLPGKPILYSFSEITRATNHFQSQKLGKSSAWKCTLRDKTVALTRRSTSNPRDFPSLFAELCSVHHAGVVKLIGACADEGYLYLAHEFENGANLSVCLRGSKLAGYTVLSSWIHRIQVATDVAKALEYMHHDIPLHYVHNHIKCSSIIVVEPDFRAKVLHCGSFFLTGEMPVKYNTGSVSEIVEEVSGESSGKLRRYGSQKISGVQGYMAPEYIENRIISQKSDVFAFGVVLLEILTGEEPVKFVYEKGEKQLKKISLVESVSGVVGVHGKLRTWMDVKLKDSYPLDCAEKVAEIAAACVALDPDERPNMRWVSSQLSRVQMKSKKWDKKYQGNKGLTTSLQGR